jgi:hypothetical protein
MSIEEVRTTAVDQTATSNRRGQDRQLNDVDRCLSDFGQKCQNGRNRDGGRHLHLCFSEHWRSVMIEMVEA